MWWKSKAGQEIAERQVLRTLWWRRWEPNEPVRRRTAVGGWHRAEAQDLWGERSRWARAAGGERRPRPVTMGTGSPDRAPRACAGGRRGRRGDARRGRPSGARRPPPAGFQKSEPVTGGGERVSAASVSGPGGDG